LRFPLRFSYLLHRFEQRLERSGSSVPASLWAG